MAAPKLYHRRPRDMVGDVLHPLNRLADIAPDAHRQQRAKYDGREALLRQAVPPLGCLWNDVLHLSPVHPGRVAELAAAAGLAWFESDWFEVDPAARGFSAADTAVFRCSRIDLPEPIPDDEFEPFDLARLAAMADVPAATRDYYHAQPAGSRNYFIFLGVPHVLHRGPLDVADAPLVRA